MPIFRLTEDLEFPDPRWAIDEGLLAIGGDLSPERLLLAYRLGIFPWYGENEPIMWWSPDPRCVLFPKDIYVSKRLERTLKQDVFQVTCNQAFGNVIKACADVRVKRGEDTWLIEEMQSAYQRLHNLGYAHSVEAWSEEGLAGGLYGVAMGKFFFGESMFHTRTNASKVILVKLCKYLQEEGFVLLDCQVPNPHLFSMGACQVSREQFLDLLASHGLGEHGIGKKVVMPEVL